MDETRFGLRQRPFRAAPDSAAYYPATSHEQALARLRQALDDDEGLALLVGGPGVGKTLLGQVLVERLGPDTTSAFLTNSHFAGRAGLFQAILFDLGLPYEGRGEQELRLALTDFLLQNFASGKKAVLIVDEAQNLDADLLEELRLLGNLEARGRKALQIVLSAQPALLDRLNDPDLAGLVQRLAVRLPLEPMDMQEAADYLMHGLRLAGGRPEAILSGEAVELLARATQGVPRRLNQAASLALALAAEAGDSSVEAEAVLEALARLGLEAPDLEADEATVMLSERAAARSRQAS